MKIFEKILCLLLVVVMCITSIPLGLDLKAGAIEYNVGNIVQFGSYPQSLVTDSDAISKLNEQTLTWISYKYMKPETRNIEDDFMKYADIDLDDDGKYDYRAVTFSKYRSRYAIDYGTPVSYQDDNGYKINEIYYFEYEPLLWRILDVDKGLVFSEDLIDAQHYNKFLYWTGYRYKNETGYVNNWSVSYIREWLNVDFYNVAFSDNEKDSIYTSTIQNKGYNNSYNYSDTEDKVFLLSYNDILNMNYGFTSSEVADATRMVKKYGTDYAKCQGLWGGKYFLRSAGFSSQSDSIVSVEQNGSIDYGAYSHSWDNYGIRPALRVDLTEVDFVEEGSPEAWKADKVKIEFRFADTKEIIDTSDEHLMDQQVAFNFTTTEDVHRMKMATNGVLYLEEYYFPLKYFKADWQSAFGDRIEYICKSTETINAKAGDTIVIYLSADENQGSVVTPPSSGDDDNFNIEKFPKGYDFYDDSYYFENYGEKISEKYFTTMYEKSHGKKLYKAGAGKTAEKGLCFGMAYTTCAINNGFPAVNQIYNMVDGKKIYKNKLRDVDKFSKLVINGNEISVDDYIKYAFIYQWSSEHNSISSSQFKNTLNDFIDNEKIGVVVELEQWETNNNGEFVLDSRGRKNRIAAHAVVAVGIEQGEGYFNALIDDSNESSDYRTMSVFETDNTWSYREYSDSYSTYRLAVDTHKPYQILATGNKTTMSDDAITYNSIAGRETYIENMDKLSADKVLLSIEGGNYDVESDANFQEIQINGFSGDSTTNDSKVDLFWVDSTSVRVTDFSSENNIVELAGDDTILSANVTKDSIVSMTIDKSDIQTEIKTNKGDEYTVSIEAITSDEYYNDVETVASITGIASGDEITAAQTETGLLVTGISDGTITLSKDDEIIATQTVIDAESDIEITYDKNGGSDSLDVEYETHTHTYTSDIVKEASCTENGICTYTCYCGDTNTETIEATGHNFNGSKCTNCDYDKADDCSCNCHKGGIAGFFFKLILFFQKIFRTNKTCSCGVAHY